MLYPITFSIPEEKIVKFIPTKTKILSNLIPGKTGNSTYIYNTEEDYYNEYKTSYFAITKRKGGWDCLRHYEILANGCIPYFINIEECPKNTLALFPKELLIESKIIYNKFINKKINELSTNDIDEYNSLLTKLLDYTRDHLTTSKVAKYILQKTNCENVSKILFLSGDLKPDYLRCLTLHGFKELFGVNCHDYPKIPHIYKSNHLNYINLYGKGITYTNLLDPIIHDENLDYVVEYILNKYYDIIIYGSGTRGLPYYDMICHLYEPSKVIMLFGEDNNIKVDYNYYLKKGHNIFVRELCDMRFYYGLHHHNIDITDYVYSKLLVTNNIIMIPSNDNVRGDLFTDPISGVHKIVIIKDNNEKLIGYNEYVNIYIHLLTQLVYTSIIPYPMQFIVKLLNIHNDLKIEYGLFNEEFPEQIMATRYLTGSEKVLEIGGNIGRNSLIIAAMLTDHTQFVSLECDLTNAEQLVHNRDLNNMHFYVENSALSKRKLIQKGWDTIVSDILLDGYKEVSTITWTELNNKYNIAFDTLVLDCEGAFYYILQDMPEILDNIKLIIMENDYLTIDHKQYVDKVLIQSGFYRDYVEIGCWEPSPCYHNFYEVWIKNGQKNGQKNEIVYYNC